MEIGPHSQTYLLYCKSSLIRYNSIDQAPLQISYLLLLLVLLSTLASLSFQHLASFLFSVSK